ncbi:MAG: hypothetical protein AB1641_23205 [Thermodesulfobacteriota bacterium]
MTFKQYPLPRLSAARPRYCWSGRHLALVLIGLLLMVGCGGPGQQVAKETDARTGGTGDSGLSASKSSSKPAYISGTIIVQFKSGLGRDELAAIEAALRLKVVRSLERQDQYLMKITDNSSVEDMIDRLNNREEVMYAEPNFVYGLN